MDAFDVVHQFLRVLKRYLLFACGTKLCRLPEQIVKVRVFLEMRRLEIIGPENKQVMLCEFELCAFWFPIRLRKSILVSNAGAIILKAR